MTNIFDDDVANVQDHEENQNNDQNEKQLDTLFKSKNRRKSDFSLELINKEI